jgi:hypothetical protein
MDATCRPSTCSSPIRSGDALVGDPWESAAETPLTW